MKPEKKLNLPFGHFSERMRTGLDEYHTILRLCGKGCKQEGFLCNHEPLYTRFVFQYNHANTSCELEEDFLNDIITSIHDSNDIVKNYVTQNCRGATSFENNLHVFFETRSANDPSSTTTPGTWQDAASLQEHCC